IGWATVHPSFLHHGWEYRGCQVWNKGPGHIAGNANSATLRKFPVVTEVCVQYVKPARFEVDGRPLSMKEWLRHEWQRSGLPMYLANQACGVENAATRKYLTACHLWYFPPVEAFVRLAAFANERGKPEGRPYFSVDGAKAISGEAWGKLRAKFFCEVGVTNVWSQPALRGQERLKEKYRSLHNNQKPLNFIELLIRASTEAGDVVWEPFGGLCPGAVASHRLDRRYVGAEMEPGFFHAAAERLATYDAPLRLIETA
ncbi:MAG TPA: DNA methyltransferase, partial [Myxococcales bacterium]|nr:DNA methyltransferase [Myxococcales bacterium]